MVLHYPDTSCASPYPTVFFIHGGFWKSKYGIDPPTAACESLAPDLASRGILAVEVEYRRNEDDEWGWPHSNNDVYQAYSHLVLLPPVDRTRIAVVGHSAGGTMAVWLLTSLLRSQAEHMPHLPAHTVALAPVADLRMAVDLRLSDEGDAVVKYMHGTPEEEEAAYNQACPTGNIDLLTTSSLTLAVGQNDTDVPAVVVKGLYDLVEQRRMAQSINATGPEYVLFGNTDHYEIVSSSSVAWQTIARKLMSYFSI